MNGFFDPATFAVSCVAMTPIAIVLLLVRDWLR